jgi:hypothetical protein
MTDLFTYDSSTERHADDHDAGELAAILGNDVPPDVVDLFERMAMEVRKRGFTRYSARAILHRIRWHYHVEKGDADFKVNNNVSARLARWLMAKHPITMRDFFETRERRSGDDD